MRIRRYISLLLAALMLVSVLPADCFAEDGNGELRTVLTDALKDRVTTLDIREYGISAADFAELFPKILEEESGLWHVQPNYKQTTSQGVMVKAYFEYLPVKEELSIRSAASYAVSCCIQSGMTDVEKALALHDYLALACGFDLTNSRSSAYEALVGGCAVGLGYARAYRILLEQVGIPSRVVESASMDHAWNQVQIGGQWYHVDVAKDDPYPDLPGRVLHTRFLLSDGRIREEGCSGWTGDVECTDTSFEEGMYWQGVSSGIWFLANGEILLRRDQEASVQILYADPDTGKQTVLFENGDSHYISDGEKYSAETGGLSVNNTTIYFGDLTKIYSLGSVYGEPQAVCTVKDFGDWDYFVSSHVEDDTLYVTVKNHKTGAQEVRTMELETPHTHVWGEWVETVKPNAQQNGVHTRTCVSCTATQTKTVSNNPFTDVGENNRFKPAILWAYYSGITAGKTATTFAPESDVTRAQFVTFLWRAAGEPEPKSDVNPFTDVPMGKYYSKAVLWAYYEGITSGTTETTFSPNKICNRGQVVMFLYRYAGEPPVENVENPFTDVNSGNRYYKAILWAHTNGITSGKTKTTFEIGSNCIRSHVVTFLYRYLAE